jgi:UDP-N-acetylglucosamine 3-dehydrogenase
MPPIRAAIIGTGRPKKLGNSTGCAIAYNHAKGYAARKDCEIVAVADIKRENAETFVEEYPGPAIYEDYLEMIDKEKPDIVSVCLWIDLHRPVVLDLIDRGVKAIYCEKPMASTYGEARRMVEAADKAGVQLTFNHQRRFGGVFKKAKSLVKAGEIGELKRLEASCPNLFDWGTHWFDIMFFYNNQTPVEWLIGQIDSRTEKTIFGVRIEDQGIAQFRFSNGVEGLLATGPSASVVGAKNRLIGTKGVIELDPDDAPKQHLRIRRIGDADWTVPKIKGNLHGQDAFTGAIGNAIDCMTNGKRPLLDCHNSLQATELIFATYESSRRRARIDLPLEIDDSPLLSMLANGDIGS